MAARECPSCGIINDPAATICECGRSLTASLSRQSFSRPYILGLFGITSTLIGLYHLINPAITGETANLHKLFIGMTLTICGAIFIAAEWRPR